MYGVGDVADEDAWSAGPHRRISDDSALDPLETCFFGELCAGHDTGPEEYGLRGDGLPALDAKLEAAVTAFYALDRDAEAQVHAVALEPALDPASGVFAEALLLRRVLQADLGNLRPA